jgi:hypothetical protein
LRQNDRTGSARGLSWIRTSKSIRNSQQPQSFERVSAFSQARHDFKQISEPQLTNSKVGQRKRRESRTPNENERTELK